MRFLILFFGVTTFSFSAFAQNTITVIQDDGKKVTIDMGSDPVVSGVENSETPQVAEPEKVEAKPVDEKAPVEKAQKFIEEKPAPVAEEPKKVEPAKAELKKEEPKKPAKKAEKKKSGKKDKSKKSQKTAKPVTQGHYEYVIPPGTVITKDLATAIALDTAPPSRGYEVKRQAYKDAEAFVVTFKTEDGPYDVIIDAKTGKVLLSSYVDLPPAAPTRPGHLSQDWEPFTPVPVRSLEKQ